MDGFRKNKVNFCLSRETMQRKVRKSLLCNRLINHDRKKVAAVDSQMHVPSMWKFDNNAAAEINFRKGGSVVPRVLSRDPPWPGLERDTCLWTRLYTYERVIVQKDATTRVVKIEQMRGVNYSTFV